MIFFTTCFYCVLVVGSVHNFGCLTCLLFVSSSLVLAVMLVLGLGIFLLCGTRCCFVTCWFYSSCVQLFLVFYLFLLSSLVLVLFRFNYFWIYGFF